MRPGNTAEAITPIIVARATGAHGIAMSGSAARSTACQEIERITSELAISASASAIQPGEAVISACPDTAQVQPRERERDQPGAQQHRQQRAASASARARGSRSPDILWCAH